MQHTKNELENQLAIANQEAALVERQLSDVKATTEQSIGAFIQFQRFCLQAIMSLYQELSPDLEEMSTDGPPVCFFCKQEGEGDLVKCSYTNCTTHFHRACALNQHPPFATEQELNQPKFFCKKEGNNGKPSCRARMNDSSKGKRGRSLGTP